MIQEEYRPPKSGVMHAKSLSFYQSCILLLLIFIAVGCYYASYVFPIKFIEVLEVFNRGLPLLTDLVLKVYPIFIFLSYFSIIFVIGLLRFFLSNENQQLIFRLAKVNAFIAFLFMIIVIVSMYLPIFAAE